MQVANSRRSGNVVAAPCSTAMALAVVAVALSSHPSPVESLAAFDVVSFRSSSAFACSSCRLRDHRRCRDAMRTTAGAGAGAGAGAYLEMKVTSGSGNSRGRSSKSSHLVELNNQRLQTAGRPGTKKFVDPNKIFIGNLPYDADEDDIHELFSEHWNVPLESVGGRIESVKIIRDWKTGKSKGYGFIQFYEPMVATSAMESINKGGRGWRIKGRRIRLDQGARKESDDDKIRKKKEEKKMSMEDLDEEGSVIHSALEEVVGGGFVGTKHLFTEEDVVVVVEEKGMMSEDDMIAFMEKGGLRGVMPLTEETAGFLRLEGLYADDEEYDEDYFEDFYHKNGFDDGDFEDDDKEEDDDELVYDGVFEEMYNPSEYEGLDEEGEEEMKKKNREQRRSAERRKKRKLPFKGFGAAP